MTDRNNIPESIKLLGVNCPMSKSEHMTKIDEKHVYVSYEGREEDFYIAAALSHGVGENRTEDDRLTWCAMLKITLHHHPCLWNNIGMHKTGFESLEALEQHISDVVSDVRTMLNRLP